MKTQWILPIIISLVLAVVAAKFADNWITNRLDGSRTDEYESVPGGGRRHAHPRRNQGGASAHQSGSIYLRRQSRPAVTLTRTS